MRRHPVRNNRRNAAGGLHGSATLQTLAKGSKPCERHHLANRFARLENERARLEQELVIWEGRQRATATRLAQVNAQAAALTGVHVPRVVISVYVLSGLAAGFSGVLIAGWLGAAPANLATGYELRVIAAAVIGGANLAGGVGGAAGAVIGAALIEVIRNGFVLIGANTYWEEVFVGVIIIIAVLVDQLRTRRVF